MGRAVALMPRPQLLLFDVDGTLTPSRGTIDPELRQWLINTPIPWALITGSDPDKTIAQVGRDLWAQGWTYNCQGNHRFYQGTEVYRSTWTLPSPVAWTLECLLQASQYPIRTGCHVEHRVGMVNFSTVGRGATADQRAEYYAWDLVSGERLAQAQHIRDIWPDLDVSVAGHSGMDISPRGTGKDQIIDQLIPLAPIWFFGDRQDPLGNDHALSQQITHRNLGQSLPVRDWQHTWQILQGL